MKYIPLLFLLLISRSGICQVPEYSVTIYDSAQTTGYYFLTDGTNLLILGRYGDAIYYKPVRAGFNFTLQKNGLMSYVDLKQCYVMDSSFTIRDTMVCQNGFKNDTRDAQLLPGGHALVLGDEWALMSSEGLPQVQKKTNRVELRVRCSVFQELDAQKKVLFEWHAKDHLSMKEVDDFYLDSNRVISLPQISSIEKDPEGNYLLACKWTNEVIKVSGINGSVLWRLGGRANQFQFIDCPVPFYGPRDARRLSNGNITFFEGGENYQSHGARAMEFELDEQNKTATLVWSYTYDSTITSNGRGNVQRLANGNTVIGYCYNSKGNLGFVVVNPEGEKIMEVHGLRSFRSFNYPSLPWQLQRPVISCYDSEGKKYLRTKKSYGSYLWSDGSNTAVRKVTEPGTYSVFVADSKGGYLRSENFYVPDIRKPCGSPPSDIVVPQKTKQEAK
ncbi:MAG: hypothetical protein IPP77_05145 [Bacteroidetes bacterium]|nr:hypothetical protein [Bacteroidota bacterium]